jgi:hypothetical protein
VLQAAPAIARDHVTAVLLLGRAWDRFTAARLGSLAHPDRTWSPVGGASAAFCPSADQRLHDHADGGIVQLL